MDGVNKLLQRVLNVIGGAIFFWAFSYFVVWRGLAEGDRFAAYIANLVMIAAMVAEDKLRTTYIRKKWRNPFRKWAWLAKRFDSFVEVDDPASIKPSLYLFYIIALVSSHVLILNPDLNAPAGKLDYLIVISYGLLLLVAADKFTLAVRKDFREMDACEGGSDE